MKVVHKFEVFSSDNSTRIALPRDAKIVLVDNQKETIQIWVELDPASRNTVIREFKIFGTGQSVTGTHVGSFIEGQYVWHVYEQEVI